MREPPHIVEPSSDLSRRTFVRTAGVGGVALALGGCVSATETVGDEESRGADDEEGTDDEPADEDGVVSDLPPTGPVEVVDLDERGGEVTLRTVHARHDVKASERMGDPIVLPEVWAWAADDGTPSVPGPVLRATEGQELAITLDNTESTKPHTFHAHGVRVAWEDDGTGETSGITVAAGETHTYTIPANVPGTHLYHCHYNTPWHMEMGMYGILRIDPEGYEPADHEQFLTVKEWDTRLSRRWGGGDVDYSLQDRNPDAFTVNGKAAPDSLNPEVGSPMIVDEDETLRVHLVNAGFESHAMHPHNHRFRVVEHDGSVVPEGLQYDRDVITVGPAERYTIELATDADPGIYPVHCHKVDHVRNGEIYPGGMLTAIVYEEAMSDDIFADLMEAAGHEMDDGDGDHDH